MGKKFIKARAHSNKYANKQSSKYICACLIYLLNSVCANYSALARRRKHSAAAGRTQCSARAGQNKLFAHTLLSKLFVREIKYLLNNIFAKFFACILRRARTLINFLVVRLSKQKIKKMFKIF